MLVCAANGYQQEVEAGETLEAVEKAFMKRLPNSIGEVMLIREWKGGKRKRPWGGARYFLSELVLQKIGASDLYNKHKRGFVLNTESPHIKLIEDDVAKISE